MRWTYFPRTWYDAARGGRVSGYCIQLADEMGRGFGDILFSVLEAGTAQAVVDAHNALITSLLQRAV
jgi:hypothetical protein